MLSGRVTVSTSSGMWVRAIEPDASISSMMFGFTSAAVVVTIGVDAMSVGPAWPIEPSDIASMAPTPRTPKRRAAKGCSAFFMMYLVFGQQSPLLNQNLGVADRVARPVDAGRDAEERLVQRPRQDARIAGAGPRLAAVDDGRIRAVLRRIE